MAMITVDIGALEDLAKAADTGSGAAKQLTNYWDKLHDKVEYEINRYSGERTGNINTAYSYVHQYRDELNNTQGQFVRFAQKTRMLKDKAASLEQTVIRTINSDLRAFCNKYGLEFKESDEKPGFWAGLWNSLCGLYYDLKERVDNFFEKISEWYNYDGGKEILDAVFTVLLVIATIVVMILAFPVLATGTLLAVIASAIVIVASAILLVFEVMDSIVKIGHAINAVSAASEDRYFDAAWESKMREESGFTDWMRDQGWYDAANILDTVKVVCEVIKFVDSFAKGFTKFKTFIKDFKFEGFFKDFGKNMKDFFGENGFGHLLFGGDYDGNFFGGEWLDVAKRVKTVLTVANVAYKEITYHDATGHKNTLERLWDRTTTAKPVIDIMAGNIWESGSTQRHDMATDPSTRIESSKQYYYDRNGDKIEIQVSEEKVVDQTTGKVTGKQQVTTYTNTRNGTQTITTQTEYGFTKADGSGQKQVISKTETRSPNGTSISDTKTTTTKIDKSNTIYDKHENTTTTVKETHSTESARGSTERTTERETTTKIDNMKKSEETTNKYTVSHSESYKNADGSKTTSTKQNTQSATYSETKGKEGETTHSSSNSRTYEKETTKQGSHVTTTKTQKETYTHTNDSKSETSSNKPKPDSHTGTKVTTWESNNKTGKGTTVAEKTSTTSSSSLPGDTIETYDKVAKGLNKQFNMGLPTSESDNLIGKGIKGVEDRGSVTGTLENIYNFVTES